MKYFRMSYEEVVFRRSYINIMLLNKAIPNFKSSSKDAEDGTPSSSKGSERASAGVKHVKPQGGHANTFFQQFM